ncbi:MAG: hypothetical protein PHW13_04240 [Methylococcales bacterium]|nr:hypothetical protein [Methylococcales bacterium]
MKVNFRTIASIFILISSFIATPVSAEPQFSLQQEAVANPNLVNAFKEINAAIKELESTQQDYGGNTAKAIADLRSARAWIKTALNYRMQMDEEHLDGSMINNR